MPVIKAPPGGFEPVYYEITRVEVFKVGAEYAWKAAFQVWASPEAAAAPNAKPIDAGFDTSVPLNVEPDLIEAYERTAVLTPGSNFFGGQIVAARAAFTSLEWARKTQWERVKMQRDATLSSGVETPYGVFDSDSTSILNLVGAAAVAAFRGDGWSQQWILKDRTTVTLSGAQLLEVGGTVADFRGRLYGLGDELYRAIQAAGTVEAVRAVTWPQGLA